MEQQTLIKKIDVAYREYGTPVSIVIAAVIIANAMSLTQGSGTAGFLGGNLSGADAKLSALEEAVLPAEGVKLPIVWGDLGAQLVEAGAIDPVAFKKIYQSRGTFSAEYEKLLSGRTNGPLTITADNAGYLLNLLWAFGLANKNPILEDKKEMMNPEYGEVGNFASTGGWTIAKGNAMDHYSKHALVTLTAEQQKLVDEVSRNIYRPCCGNSVHFPDCNHGMAMLGLLELMASQGVSEKDMYKTALVVNSYWFPDTYLTIAMYMQSKGVSWGAVSPKEMLGADYSSAAGFQNISSQVNVPSGNGGGGGCGVDTGASAAPQQQSGCGV
ncbi:MAG: hypothetical protein Q7S50_00545 [bacterium]|nr:hypothetical protein [bacterium]